jgi:CheY-like chemotaxis protein
MQRFSINTEMCLEFSHRLPKMLVERFTLMYSGMAEFNIKETGNDLLRILEEVLGSRNTYQLTIDVLIPEILKGDKRGLCNSIALICQYLNGHVLRLLVDIELLKGGQSGSSVKLNIDVKGVSPEGVLTQSLNTFREAEIDVLLAHLPDKTVFHRSESYVRFSFSMIFQCPETIKYTFYPFENKRILLVEDDDVSASVFISFLEEWGCIVEKVSNGILGVQAAKTASYDLILMDIYMPEMPGDEAIRKIREFDRKVPIIALISCLAEKNIFNANEAGANDNLVKPVSSAELQRILTRYS